MKYSFALISTIFASAALADNVEYATILLGDVQNNLLQYGALLQDGSVSLPTIIFDYYTKIQTYTDDSYTSILTDFPASQVDSVVTEFPWYSSRLETKLQAALTDDIEATSSSSAPASSSISTDSTITSFSSSSSSSSSFLSLTPVITTIETSEADTFSSYEIATYEGGAVAGNSKQVMVLLASPLLLSLFL